LLDWSGAVVLKALQFAPIAVTTGSVIALLVWKDADPWINKIIKATLIIGLLATLFQTIFDFIDRQAVSERTQAEIARAVADERARALEAQRRAAEAEAAISRIREESAVAQRRAIVERDTALRESENRRIDEIRRRDNERSAAEAERLRLTAEIERLRADAGRVARENSDRENAYCQSCCNSRAPLFDPKYNPATAIGVCLSECTSQRPSNWFGNNAVLCRR
jgi:flagellar biosynthesis GTPase FlhF